MASSSGSFGREQHPAVLGDRFRSRWYRRSLAVVARTTSTPSSLGLSAATPSSSALSAAASRHAASSRDEGAGSATPRDAEAPGDAEAGRDGREAPGHAEAPGDAEASGDDGDEAGPYGDAEAWPRITRAQDRQHRAQDPGRTVPESGPESEEPQEGDERLRLRRCLLRGKRQGTVS